MEITLRRAARLLSAIEEKLNELGTKVVSSTAKTVYVGDNPSDITTRIATTRQEGLDAWRNLRALVTCRTTIRGLVGAANAKNKVSDLVTQLKGFEKARLWLTNLRGRAGDEPALSDRELQVRLTALKGDSSSKVQVAYNVRGRNEDNVAFQTYTQEDLDTFEEQERALKKNIDGTQDQIERINNTVLFEIPADVEKTLTELKVL